MSEILRRMRAGRAARSTARSSSSTTARSTGPTRCCPPSRTRRCRSSPIRSTGARAPPCAPAWRGARRPGPHPGRRSRVRPGGLAPAARPDPAGPGHRGLTGAGSSASGGNMLFSHWVGRPFAGSARHHCSTTWPSPTWRRATSCSTASCSTAWRSQSDGFDFEPEITAKLLRQGNRIYEVPVAYAGREPARARRSPGATTSGPAGRSSGCASPLRMPAPGPHSPEPSEPGGDAAGISAVVVNYHAGAVPARLRRRAPRRGRRRHRRGRQRLRRRRGGRHGVGPPRRAVAALGGQHRLRPGRQPRCRGAAAAAYLLVCNPDRGAAPGRRRRPGRRPGRRRRGSASPGPA